MALHSDTVIDGTVGIHEWLTSLPKLKSRKIPVMIPIQNGLDEFLSACPLLQRWLVSCVSMCPEGKIEGQYRLDDARRIDSIDVVDLTHHLPTNEAHYETDQDPNRYQPIKQHFP